jgi:hypothetical protein
MVSKKKAVAILLVLTLGGYALYKLTQSKASGTSGGTGGMGGTSGTGGTSTGLAIQNYSVTYDCSVRRILVTGTLVNSKGAVTGAYGNVGFCSNFDFNKNDFINPTLTYSIATTDGGNFKAYVMTGTPAGGQNCIVTRFQVGNDVAVAKANVTIPGCAGNPIGIRQR